MKYFQPFYFSVATAMLQNSSACNVCMKKTNWTEFTIWLAFGKTRRMWIIHLKSSTCCLADCPCIEPLRCKSDEQHLVLWQGEVYSQQQDLDVLLWWVRWAASCYVTGWSVWPAAGPWCATVVGQMSSILFCERVKCMASSRTLMC